MLEQHRQLQRCLNQQIRWAPKKRADEGSEALTTVKGDVCPAGARLPHWDKKLSVDEIGKPFCQDTSCRVECKESSLMDSWSGVGASLRGAKGRAPGEHSRPVNPMYRVVKRS